MSIIRIKKERKYAMISNAMMNDASLTWEARGLLAYLLCKPDGWECSRHDLALEGPSTLEVTLGVIERVIKELQGAGLVDCYSRGGEWVTEIFESPSLNTMWFKAAERIEL